MTQVVSIVMCTYNGAKFLQEQLDSITNQTYRNIEIIICDDGSTDNTLDILNNAKEKDSRIKIYQNDANLGLNKNFEKGCLLATGEFIAICDQDDIWKGNKIERLLNLFNTETVLAHASSVRFSNSPPANITHYTKRHLFEGNDVRKLFFFNTIAGHNIMFRRSMLQNALPFPDNIFYDWWLCVIAAVYGRVNSINEVLTFHREHDNNVTLGKGDEKRQTLQKAEERIRSLRKFIEIPELSSEARSFGNKLMTKLTSLQPMKFSWSLFFFLLTNSRTIFFFKKNAFPFITFIKISYRLSWAI